MLEEIQGNKEAIMSRFRTTKTHKKKAETSQWRKVSESVNACEVAVRSVDVIKN